MYYNENTSLSKDQFEYLVGTMVSPDLHIYFKYEPITVTQFATHYRSLVLKHLKRNETLSVAKITEEILNHLGVG